MARVEVVPCSIARTYSFAICGLLSALGGGKRPGEATPGAGVASRNPSAG
jgi:hypothetical protein